MIYGPIGISIPAYRRVDERDRSFTVFSITVSVPGKKYSIEKRYTEFEELHRQLKSMFPSLLFPGKSVLKWSPKVLEYRRQAFENYLKAVVQHQQVPRSVMTFLKVKDNFQSSESLDASFSSCVSQSPQPIIAFTDDAFLHEYTRDGLPDIISSGTLQGLYDSHGSVSDM